MRKIGLVTTPLVSGHAVRGVGFYTRRLLAGLLSQAKKYGLQIVEIDNPSQLSQIDLVHYPFFDLFSNTLPQSKNIKTVVTIHDVTPLEFPKHYPPGVKGWWQFQQQKQALNDVDLVLTDSYSSLKSIQRMLFVPHSKLRLVYLAADEQFKPLKNKKVLSTIRIKYQLPLKFVLYVGDINWNKNVPGLIKACKEAKLPLVVVGKQAKEVEQMNLDHPQLEHLKDIDWTSVQRLGFVPDSDLVAIYNLAKVYCQPSFAEGFGLGVLEAMACGTAVACSNTHSLPEIAGSATTYFDPTNTDEMAKALLKGPTGKEISQAGKFSWTKTAEETLMAYQEVLKQ